MKRELVTWTVFFLLIITKVVSASPQDSANTTSAGADVLRNADHRTEKASDAMRRLCFAGFAIAWLLSRQNPEKLFAEFSAPLIAFASALALDALHYALAGCFYSVAVLQKMPQREPWLDAPGALIWPAKITAGLLGYALLLFVIVRSRRTAALQTASPDT